MGRIQARGTKYITKPHNQLPLQKIKGESPVKICPQCHAVYFDKHWHSNKFLHQAYNWHTKVGYELFPEDRWLKGGAAAVNYEGEVILKNIPKEKIQEIVQQIRNIGKRATARDPEDKIIKIEIKGRQVRVLTTENQLAASIGKQIDEAHKGGKLDIKWSKDDQLARVDWDYK